jgi:phosphate/sulfate permease
MIQDPGIRIAYRTWTSILFLCAATVLVAMSFSNRLPTEQALLLGIVGVGVALGKPDVVIQGGEHALPLFSPAAVNAFIANVVGTVSQKQAVAT